MRRVICAVLCLLLCMGLLLPVGAVSPGSYLYRDYDVAGDQVICYGRALPQPGTLSVSRGDQKVESAAFSTFRANKTPVTVYCLVDSSTGLGQSVQKQQIEALQTLNSLLGPQDAMVISTVDKTFFEGEHLTDPIARKTAIESIVRNHWQSNLFAGIEKAVDSLSATTTFHTNRFLVVLTDGHIDGKTDSNLNAITEKISFSRFPVYAMVLGNSGSGRTQSALIELKQLCEASMGGNLLNLAKESLSVVNAVETIWDSIQNSSVITMDTADIACGTDVQLLVRYETSDTRFEDTMLIRAMDLAQVQATAPVDSPDGGIDGTEESTEAEDEQAREIPWLLIGILGAAFAAAAMVFLAGRRKKATASIQTAEKDTPNNDSDLQPGFGNTWDKNSTEEFNNDVYTDALPTTPLRGDCHVFMVAIMHSEVTRDFWLIKGTPVNVGRDSKSGIVLNSGDRNLSRIHAAFLWDGVHLLVQDKHSTCGTFINGTPCKGEAWSLVENNANLRLGAFDYRVTYEKKSGEVR